jgi:predicted regulator of Ras-like GTPase activity (Roadblock/LC7/MglB family)
MLASLVDRVRGSRGAIVCDYEGEFVGLTIRDQQLTEYELRVVGAQVAAAWLNLHNGASHGGAGAAVEMKVLCPRGTLLCRALRDGYYLVLLLESGSPSGVASFELKRTATEISPELG